MAVAAAGLCDWSSVVCVCVCVRGCWKLLCCGARVLLCAVSCISCVGLLSLRCVECVTARTLLVDTRKQCWAAICLV